LSDKVRAALIAAQQQGILEHVVDAGPRMSAGDRLALARATALLIDCDRLEAGKPTEVSVVRSVSSLEDALQVLIEDSEGAEEET
jgi:hypothetical protein